MRRCIYHYTSLQGRSVSSLQCTTTTSHPSGFCSRHANWRISQIGTINLTDLLTEDASQQVLPQIIGPYRGFALPMLNLVHYEPFGDQVQCSYCDAFLFLHEASRQGVDTSSSLCCGNGRLSSVQSFSQLPTNIRLLLYGSDAQSRDFQDNIRLYNSLMAPAWTKSNIDPALATRQTGFYCITTNGRISHVVSDLTVNASEARFGQIYIFDTATQLQRRLSMFPDLNRATLGILQEDLLANNPVLRTYQSVGELMARSTVSPDQITLHLRPDYPSSADDSHPTAQEVAAVIVGDDELSVVDRTVICRLRGSRDDADPVGFHNVHPLNGLYDSLSYPLIFPYGQLGWRPDMQDREGRAISTAKFYRHFFFERSQNKDLFCMKRLLHQFVLDAYLKIEGFRLSYILQNQERLRNVAYGHIQHMRSILPATFVGGRRYMIEKYRDAMAIVREFGKPSLFITMTCNPEWPEIVSALRSNQTANDRLDLICRVFKGKLYRLFDVLEKHRMFGRVLARVHTIEFQKRGLPHAHIVVWLEQATDPNTAETVDLLVNAEIPDHNQALHDVVMKFMTHGPCGPGSVCFQGNQCKRGFPKPFQQTTIFSDSRVLYKRRQGSISINSRGESVSNANIVPYSPILLKLFCCHINVEIPSSLDTIKYLFKYIHKGQDRARAVATNQNEVELHINGRYVSAMEGMWRIFQFPIQANFPSVTRLDLHLPLPNAIDDTSLIHQEDEEDISLEEANSHFHPSLLNADFDESCFDGTSLADYATSSLIAYFEYNAMHSDARSLLYLDFPRHFVLIRNQSGRLQWRRRTTDAQAIGRYYLTRPNLRRLHFLRVLLNHTAGATHFRDLRMVNGTLHNSFRAAAIARGLCESGRDLQDLLEEARRNSMPRQIRALFCTILVFYDPPNYADLYNNYHAAMMEDYVYAEERHPEHILLIDIESQLNALGRSLSSFPQMPRVPSSAESRYQTLLQSETIESIETLHGRVENSLEMMNAEQLAIFFTVQSDIESSGSSHRQYFLSGSGGCGKSFLLNTLLDYVRSRGKIAVATAMTGIASTLLHGGNTAHRRFQLTLNPDTDSMTEMRGVSPQWRIIKEAHLIVVDEATMLKSASLRELDLRLRRLMSMGNDVADTQRISFGGKCIIFSGDWKQTLPVVPHGSTADILASTMKFSPFWPSLIQFNLTQNMRLLNQQDPAIRNWSQFLLQVGHPDDQNQEIRDVELPRDIVLRTSCLETLIDFVFPNFEDLTNSSLSAILCPRNSEVSEINDFIVERLPGQIVSQFSMDSLMDGTARDDRTTITPEFLNRIDDPSLPPHCLKLKGGMRVMLLRNLNTGVGLCNGQVVQILSIHEHYLRVSIISGAFASTEHLIPRVPILCDNEKYPFKFKRIQYPVRPAYAMTINKSQGQTLERVGVYLMNPVFTHGQLYVALSRVRSHLDIRILLSDPSSSVTKNIVFSEILRN